MARKKNLPQRKPSEKTHQKNLEVKIKQSFVLYSKLGIRTTKMAIMLGKSLFRLKEISKTDQSKWSDYASKQFPDISARTMQRFMTLGRCIDLDKYENLSLLSQVTLQKLSKLSGEGDVGEYLESSGISNPKFDCENSKSVSKFKREITDYLKNESSKKPRRKIGKSKLKNNKDIKIIRKAEKMITTWAKLRITNKISAAGATRIWLKELKELIEAILEI